MIRIKKSKLPQKIVIKTEEDYRSEEVLLLLRQDFFDKCYICEEKDSSSINVEHFHSCKNYEDLKYNWENLFLACVHCNRIKGSKYDHIIDCSKEDPEKYIILRFNSYPENYVEVLDRLIGSENEKTKELLDKIYNGTGTPISEYEAKNLKKKISKEIREFTECVDSYYDESDPKLRAAYWKKLGKMLSRESNFAGFKRSMVFQSEELMRRFGELVD